LPDSKEMVRQQNWINHSQLANTVTLFAKENHQTKVPRSDRSAIPTSTIKRKGKNLQKWIGLIK